jgi:peptidyl-tRNA hydrolase
MTGPHASSERRAFSLLEVILALALSAIVIFLVAGAIDFHLRQLTVRRTSIEEAQLARAILRRIADDLRAVVVDRPIDFSSVNQLTQAAAQGASGQSTNGSASGGTSGDTSGDSAMSTEIVDTGLLSESPGVYGNTYELQVDVSRIPRYEEYAVIEPTGDLLRLLSDVKTVSYFLIGQDGLSTNSLGMNNAVNSRTSPMAANYSMLGLPPGQPLRGLGRRVVDRAATRYAMNNGDSSFLDLQTELIAPEVLLIQFRYFDGLQWLSAWDSQQLGGVPMAVEIILALQTSEESAQSESLLTEMSFDATTAQLDPNHVYRLVVHLPAAEVIDTTTATSTTSTTQ